MKRRLAITTVVLLGMTMTAMAQSCPQGGRRGQQDGPGMHRGMGHGTPGLSMLLLHADDLKLTDTQIEQLEGLRTEFQTERIDRQADVKKANVKLRSLFRNEDASETEVFRAIDEESRLKAEMKKMHFRHFKAVQSILTEEQRDMIKEDMRRGRPGKLGMSFGDDDEEEVMVKRRKRIHRILGEDW